MLECYSYCYYYYLCCWFSFNWTLYQRLLQIRLGPSKDLQKENLWGLLILKHDVSGQMPFLLPSQWCQNTEEVKMLYVIGSDFRQWLWIIGICRVNAFVIYVTFSCVNIYTRNAMRKQYTEICYCVNLWQNPALSASLCIPSEGNLFINYLLVYYIYIVKNGMVY